MREDTAPVPEDPYGIAKLAVELDLAAAHEMFGLPFVFAAWIVRPGVELGEAATAFLRARRRGAAGLEELVESAVRDWELPREACATYLGRECLYEPGEEMHPALVAFGRAAARLELCSGDLEPTPIELPADPRPSPQPT